MGRTPRTMFLGLLVGLAAASMPAVSSAQSSAPSAPESIASSVPASSAPPSAPSSAPPASDDGDDGDESEPPRVQLAPAADLEREPAVRRERRPPPPPGYGRLRIAVNRPDTEVFVDDHRVGIAPFEDDLLHGPHNVRLRSPGFKEWHGSVAVDEHSLVPLRALLRPVPDRSAGYMTLTIATLILGAGVGAGIGSNLDHDALERDRMAGTLDNHDPRIDRGAILAGVADGCFALTAVLVAAGIYLLARDNTPASIARVGRPHPIGATPHPAASVAP